MKMAVLEKIENLESVVTACYGKPQGDELPQVANTEEIIATITEDEQSTTLQ